MQATLTTAPIDYGSLVENLRETGAGAVVLFLGTVRDFSEGKSVLSLDYEAYPAMAEAKLLEIVTEARTRWPLRDAAVVHRHGPLKLGDIAVAVATSSAHRAEAFAAAQWIMDTIKLHAPIWKKENWADGSAEWSHPRTAELTGDVNNSRRETLS